MAGPVVGLVIVGAVRGANLEEVAFARTVGGQVGTLFLAAQAHVLLGVEAVVFGGPNLYVGNFLIEQVRIALGAAGRGAEEEIIAVFAEGKGAVVRDAVFPVEPSPGVVGDTLGRFFVVLPVVQEEGFLFVLRLLIRGEEGHLRTVVADGQTGVVAFAFAQVVPGEFVGCQAQNAGGPTAVLCRLVRYDDRFVARQLVVLHAFQVKAVLVFEVAYEQAEGVFVQSFLQAVGQGRGGGVGVAAAPAFAGFEGADVGDQQRLGVAQVPDQEGVHGFQFVLRFLLFF